MVASPLWRLAVEMWICRPTSPNHPQVMKTSTAGRLLESSTTNLEPAILTTNHHYKELEFTQGSAILTACHLKVSNHSVCQQHTFSYTSRSIYLLC